MGENAMTNIIEVQVGSDFLIFCTCGWEIRTKSSEQLEIFIEEHTDSTGHKWADEEGPTFEEIMENYETEKARYAHCEHNWVIDEKLSNEDHIFERCQGICGWGRML